MASPTILQSRDIYQTIALIRSNIDSTCSVQDGYGMSVEAVSNMIARVRVECAWSQQMNVIGAIIGGPEPGGFRLPATYRIPQAIITINQTPIDPRNRPLLYASEYAMVQFGDFTAADSILNAESGLTTEKVPPKAVIDFVFTAPSWSKQQVSTTNTVDGQDVTVLEDWYITERFDASAEYLALPRQKLYWDPVSASSREPLEESPPKAIPGGLYECTRHFMKFEELQAANFFVALAGTTNDNYYWSPTFATLFAKETLMFDVPVIEKKTNSPYGVYYDVTFRMRYRPNDPIPENRSSTEAVGVVAAVDAVDFPGGWNTQFRPGKQPDGRWPLYLETEPEDLSKSVYFRPYVPADWSGVLPFAFTQ